VAQAHAELDRATGGIARNVLRAPRRDRHVELGLVGGRQHVDRQLVAEHAPVLEKPAARGDGLTPPGGENASPAGGESRILGAGRAQVDRTTTSRVDHESLEGWKCGAAGIEANGKDGIEGDVHAARLTDAVLELL